MKLKNIGRRSFNCGGVWIPPGETVIVNDNSNWQYWVDKGKAMAVQVNLYEGKKYNRDELEMLKMDELRDIGEPIGAKDTKKSELINEILEKQG